MKRLLLLAGALLVMTASVWAGPLFTQCPATGVNTGCQFLITVGAGGTTTVAQDTVSPNNGPYDGSDDTLVGIQNTGTTPISSIPLSSPLTIFGFESDGPCTQSPAPKSCPSSAGFPADPSGYGGPGVTYSGINGATTAGVVNFSPAIAPGGSAWFGLEDALTISQIVTGPPNTSGGGTGVPEPASLALMGSGLGALALMLRRRKA